jgi:hypothetical protein
MLPRHRRETLCAFGIHEPAGSITIMLTFLVDFEDAASDVGGETHELQAIGQNDCIARMIGVRRDKNASPARARH